MPFWWRRRRKPWYTTRRFRRYRAPRKRKYQRRRRPRRFARRRRRRRRKYKVRRKLQKITIKQWQPDRIVKCKISGYGYLVCGAEGNQHRCYTVDKHNYGQPKQPGGGGFGCEQYTLEYLYKEWQAHRNTWSTSNDFTDLVRYTGCTITFFPHEKTDFVVAYDRQPPFNFNNSTYLQTHPYNLLLKKHHKVIKSKVTAPNRTKPYKLRIRPPKQMITKWFFQPEFAEVPLFRLMGAATNFSYSLYGPNTQSPNLTIYALNTDFYALHNWGDASLQATFYRPYGNIPHTTNNSLTFKLPNNKSKAVVINSYPESIAFDTGWFQPAVLGAYQVINTQTHTPLHNRPIAIARYNPEEDDGRGNRIWLTSIMTNQTWHQPTDQNLLIGEVPLYMAFWGLWDYVIKTKKTDNILSLTMFVVKSPYIKIIVGGTKQDTWPIIDFSFIQGKMPWDEELTVQQKAMWYPTCHKQIQTINSFVACGPFCPKYAYLPISTWQLSYKYNFYFKWGGAQLGDKIIQDPKDQETYPVPDKQSEILQIYDPLRQHCQSFPKPWDFRRGIITATALKRIQDHLEIDESDKSDFSATPKKKRKITTEIPSSDEEEKEIQSCLQSLCKKDSFPEETQDLKLLIYKQHEQQQQLKLNLFKLLKKLNKTQSYVQMQTGLL
nr:MAG: ORF1 [Torque teno midi virus]